MNKILIYSIESFFYFVVIVIVLNFVNAYYPADNDSRFNVVASTVDSCDFPKYQLTYKNVTSKSYNWCSEKTQQRHDVIELANVMRLYIKGNNLSGLVAANLGVNRRIMVFKDKILINPEIRTDDESLATKICTFSCGKDDKNIQISMSIWVRVLYLTNEFLPTKEKFDGGDACMVQYLMFSLDGKNLLNEC
jgi:hypothetical protein